MSTENFTYQFSAASVWHLAELLDSANEVKSLEVVPSETHTESLGIKYLKGKYNTLIPVDTKLNTLLAEHHIKNGNLVIDTFGNLIAIIPSPESKK
jgi:hypothetical protein